MVFDSFKFEYDSVDRYVSGTLGAVTIVRALCGYDIFMKAALGSIKATTYLMPCETDRYFTGAH